jgi:hypothetical protein
MKMRTTFIFLSPDISVGPREYDNNTSGSVKNDSCLTTQLIINFFEWTLFRGDINLLSWIQLCDICTRNY